MGLHYAGIALSMMRSKPIRSVLSLLGIFIGVLALVVILAIHEGARQSIDNLYRTEGAQVFLVMPSYDEATMRMGTLSPEDVTRLTVSPSILSVLPRLNTDMDVRTPAVQRKAQVIGIDSAFVPIYRIPLLEGRTFLDSEVALHQPVCLITTQGRSHLFPLSSPLGQFVDIQGDACQVVGVVAWDAEISQRAFINGDADLLLPYTELLRKRDERLSFNMIPMLEVRGQPSAASDDMIREIHKVLSHGDAQRQKLFSIASLTNYLKGTKESNERMLKSLLAIAAISLLVGAIGIANVMLTSVTERTREIGVRKALGAQRIDILLQFLVEAAVLTASGGLLALLAGIVGISILPSLVPQMPLMILPKMPMLACFLLTFVIGVLAGAYPASRAAVLSPAEALRYE